MPSTARKTGLLEAHPSRKRSGKLADRETLVSQYNQVKNLSHEWLRRQIIQNNRIDILATHILGLQVQPFHQELMRFQFLHSESLQLCFRGAGKSTTCTVTKAIHLLLKNPNLRILIASKTVANAKGFLKEIKNHFESNTLLAEVFGPYYDEKLIKKWDETEIIVLPRTSPNKEASITCVGVEGTVVSKHYDVIISDDLVDEDNSRTEGQRAKTKTWYYTTLVPTLEPPDPAVEHRGEHHHLGTRYHWADLWGHLIAEELKDHHQIIPALDKQGRSPWPDKYPPSFFKEKRRRSGLIIFNAQMQCHSEDTEFLTETGWKKWEDVGDLRVATVSMPEGELEYQKPIGRTRLPVDGHLLRIRSRKINALVTPNHRMLARPFGGGERTSPPQGTWHKVEAQDLAFSLDHSVLYSGVIWNGKERKTFEIPEGRGGRKDGRGGVKSFHPGKVVRMDDFLRFLGFFISEGSTAAKSVGGVRLDQNEGLVLESMRGCFRSMGLSFKENTNAADKCVSLDARHAGLWSWLRKEVKTNSIDAKIPRFVFSLPPRQLRIIFNALMAGDGYTFQGTKSKSYQYTTISKQLADDVQELATLLCFDASLKQGSPSQWQKEAGKPGAFCVCVRRSIGNGVLAEQITPERYKGNVVCFNVPNGTLITRLGGKVLVSSNCDTEAMKGEIFSYDDCQELDESAFPSTTKGLRVFMGVDLAISEDEKNDKFAIVVLGINKTRTAFYVLDFFEDNIRFSAQTKKILQLWKKWDPVRIGIETNQYQLAQYQELKEQEPDIRLKRIETDKDKITRAWKLSPLFEDKKIFFRKGVQNTLIDRLVLFPNDFKDAFDAFDHAVRASRVGSKGRKRETEPGLI